MDRSVGTRRSDTTAVAGGERGGPHGGQRATRSAAADTPGEQPLPGLLPHEPPFCTLVAGPVRTLGHAQIRNSVGRLGHPETTTLSEPVRPGRSAIPDHACSCPSRRGRFWHRRAACACRDFWAALPISEWRGSPKSGAGWRDRACVILFGPSLFAMKPLSDHASFGDRARTGLRNVLLRPRRHELCLGGSMTSRQATTVAMSSRRPWRQ